MEQPDIQSADLQIGKHREPGGAVHPQRRARDQKTFLQSLFFRPGGDITQEQGQAVARIVLAACGTMLFFAARQLGRGDEPFLLALAYMLASFFYLSFVSRNKDTFLWRRYPVILLDLGVASYLTAHFSSAGVAFYPLFLWVMIGNGIRYGERFMQFATLFGLLAFTGAMATSGFLWNHPGTYIGLMFGLVLMPRFFLVMIDRLSEANSELKEQKEQAEFMATHDVLTGLPNRAYLHTRMEQTLAQARRERRNVAVAFIDLDSFKSINDSFGHEYGDYLLCQVADAMTGVLRASDTVSRLGGDEFVVVIEDSGDGARIGRVIERLFSCVGRYYTIGEYETYVTWSCGVVIYPRDGEDIHSLLKHADTAMYAAKSLGPNNYTFYDTAMSALVGEQLALRDELRQALEREQLEVYYQPIVDAHSGRISSAEALLRWNHPKHGLLSPSRFIEVAEQSGLINPIGDWVLRQALRMATDWRARSGKDVSVHVNVSAHQLKQQDFAQQVEAALQAAGLPAHALDLEMTESALIEDANRTVALLESLKAIGVRIALDDFGTGFSSLSYLKELPVDSIKIDKSFIDDLPAGDRDSALVEAVLMLGQRLDNHIVAEGVESREQLEWLVAHGCRYLQGYHFSRPVPLAQFHALAPEVFEIPRMSRQQRVAGFAERAR
ncbi:MAG: EAL domain-containing protein [Chromatiaceae bacterium]|nr:EAL domain-containing protein [Chromatiaceae bacterium]